MPQIREETSIALPVKHGDQTNAFSGHAEIALAPQLDDTHSQAVNSKLRPAVYTIAKTRVPKVVRRTDAWYSQLMMRRLIADDVDQRRRRREQ